MFAPSDSWTLPSHLYLVSGWSATCPGLDPMNCRSDLKFPGRNRAPDDRKYWIPADGAPRPYVWGDITWLLYNAGVSWGYYVGNDTCIRPPCEGRSRLEIARTRSSTRSPDSRRSRSRSSSRTSGPHDDFFAAARDGTLPSVSWVMPAYGESDHPPESIEPGQAWVTQARERRDEGPGVGADRDLPHLG